MGDDDSVEYIKVQTIGGKDFYVAGKARDPEPIAMTSNLQWTDVDRNDNLSMLIASAQAAQVREDQLTALLNGTTTATAANDLANSKYVSAAQASNLNITGSHNIDALIDAVLPKHPAYIKMQEDLAATREMQENSEVIVEMMADEIKQLRGEIEKLKDAIQPTINVSTVTGVKSPMYSVFRRETLDDEVEAVDENTQKKIDEALTASEVLAKRGRAAAKATKATKAANHGTLTYDLEAIAEAIMDHDEESRWAEESTLSSWSKFLKKRTNDWGYE